jgi:DNA-binding IclR family transcriptional regulator
MNETIPRTTCQDTPRSNALLNRILGEFKEMPAAALTLPQASRLFGLPEATCLRILIRLTDANALCVRGDGRYSLKSQPASPYGATSEL